MFPRTTHLSFHAACSKPICMQFKRFQSGQNLSGDFVDSESFKTDTRFINKHLHITTCMLDER